MTEPKRAKSDQGRPDRAGAGDRASTNQRTALITGPTAGIGRGYAEALARRGYDLVLVARNTERLRQLADELSGRYGTDNEVLSADLAADDPAPLATVERRLADPDRPIDLLVNNAGFGLRHGFLSNDVADEQRLLNVLVRAVLRLSKAAADPMVERGHGTIMNVSSVAGYAAYGTYGAAKSWVTAFSEALFVELGRKGVRVVAICPGFVRTEFHDRASLRVEGATGLFWLNVDDVIRDSMAWLERGSRKPVLVPTRRYRFFTQLIRHAPRRLVIGSRMMRMRSR